ncbi:hypothetical protein M3Y97_00186900 [Aphelenchoides bicaudatus]|nr:hypothetical protein M3Y97_00186900 [Aphelenchoides bicaudatus]
MFFSTSKTLLRFKRKKEGRCLCGLLSIRTGILLVSFLAFITDASVFYVSLYPRWLDANFEMLNVARTSFLNPRIAGVIVGAFGMVTSFLLFAGNRCNEHYFYVLFLIGTGFIIIYNYYAAFVFLFRALLLVEEKGDIRASKRYVEAALLILTSIFNVYFAAVVSG